MIRLILLVLPTPKINNESGKFALQLGQPKPPNFFYLSYIDNA